jgi:DNA-binding NarL/FixJ family response regulator
MTISVMLADDHAVVREGYRRLLERTRDIEVRSEAASGEEAYRTYCAAQPDVAIMDINLPGVSGVEVTRRIVARDPAARVLVFSMHEDVVFASRALQAGARGYVTKSSAPDVLVDAIRAVADGRTYVSHDVAQKLALQLMPGQNVPFADLSPREFEVFRLLAEGRSIGEIARSLSLSQKTVSNYQSIVKQKLEADSSAQMVWIALRGGLVGSGGQ